MRGGLVMRLSVSSTISSTAYVAANKANPEVCYGRAIPTRGHGRGPRADERWPGGGCWPMGGHKVLGVSANRTSGGKLKNMRCSLASCLPAVTPFRQTGAMKGMHAGNRHKTRHRRVHSLEAHGAGRKLMHGIQRRRQPCIS
jgi:hypothetical protein